jgi:hypothetical protein
MTRREKGNQEGLTLPCRSESLGKYRKTRRQKEVGNVYQGMEYEETGDEWKDLINTSN